MIFSNKLCNTEALSSLIMSIVKIIPSRVSVSVCGIPGKNAETLGFLENSGWLEGMTFTLAFASNPQCSYETVIHY